MAMETMLPRAVLSTATLAVIPDLSTTREPPWAITSYRLQVPPSAQEQHSTFPALISTEAYGLRLKATISDAMNMALLLGFGPGTDVKGPQPPSTSAGSLFFQEHPARATQSRTRRV